MTIILKTCLLRVWCLTKCCKLFGLLYVYLNFHAWKSCWSLAYEFEIALLPITADFEVDFYLKSIYICGKIFCTRYLFVCLCWSCSIVMQFNGLSVKSWSEKELQLCIFSCSVECIFCNWKFGICIIPFHAKRRLTTDNLSIAPCNCCETYIVENMSCSISDTYIKLQNSFCPNS